MLDDLTVLIKSHGGDPTLGKKLAVIRFRQILLNGRGDLGVKHRALFDADFTQIQLAAERGFDPAPGRRLLARYRAPHPRPVVELLLSRAALSCAFGGCAIHEVGCDASYSIGGVRHNVLSM